MTCKCCGGKGYVDDVMGEPRPCSRCSDPSEFSRWYQGKLVERDVADAEHRMQKKAKAASDKRRKRR